MPDKPDFSVDAESDFPSRPARFVPVKVAIYDKEASEALQRTQQSLGLNHLKQDSSVYQWVYRTEMQYSVFELDIEQINTVSTDAEGEEQRRELTDSSTPVIAGNDGALEVKQRLLGSDYDPLSLFSSEESLLLKLEGYDLKR